LTRDLKDVSKSVHTRLLNLARKNGRPFSDLFRLYAMERFLYRLSLSPHAKKFVLKGGLMLRVWDASSVRPTKDMDLLGHTESSVENLERIVREICDQKVELDGIRFEPASVGGALIKENDEYSGVRVKFLGYLGRAEAAMQLDVGFGDSVVPAPVEVEVPTLLDLPAPRLRAYQRETTIAEKLHAMTVFGMLNGRMKDFYDLWFLSRRFSFEHASLHAAIRATFEARDTAIEINPVALTQEFSAQAQERWSAFLRKSGLGDAPRSLAEVIAAVAEFLLPLLGDGLPGAEWPAGGPWRK
jgi:predicted nucleotidyltransferase component of viral defense system